MQVLVPTVECTSFLSIFIIDIMIIISLYIYIQSMV